MFSLNTITKLSDPAKLVGILVTEISTIIPDWKYSFGQSENLNILT